MRHESDSDEQKLEEVVSEEPESPLATLLGYPPQRRHWKEFQLLMIVTCQALGQEFDISQGVLSTIPKIVLQIGWGLSVLLPHRTLVMFEATICPVKILDIPDSFAGRVGHPSMLLLLSRFCGVRLCDPRDGSPPGSPVPRHCLLHIPA